MQARRSPFDDVGEELRDEALVVRLDLLDVDGLVALAVEVVRVESSHSRQRLLVLGVGQVLVSVLAVPAVRLLI